MSNHLICGSSRKLGSRVTLAGVVGVAVTLALPPVIGQVTRPWSITEGGRGRRPVVAAFGGARVASKTSSSGARASGTRRPVAGGATVSRASTGPRGVVGTAPSGTLAATFNPVPSFQRIRTDIDMVADGLEPLLKLDEELQALGKELTEKVRELGENQYNPLVASEANKLITKIQSRLIETIGKVLVNSDLIELGIDSANRKLGSLERYLKRTEARFQTGATVIGKDLELRRQAAVDAVDEYLEFLDTLDEPVSREDRLKALKLEARVQEKKFRLDLLELDRRRQSAVASGYANMSGALGRWIDDFNVLKSKTKVMVNQLEAEQDFLAKGVKLSVDAARVRHFMENPLQLPDGTPIKAVNEKVAKIFSMIEVFTGVQGRVQESLFGFNVPLAETHLARTDTEIDGMRKRAADLKRQIVR